MPPEFFIRGDGVSAYFIGLGAAVFGLLAIGFSLQTLVIQNTAENRSAGLYEIEGRDWVPTAIFILLSLISLCFFFVSQWAMGMVAEERRISVVASIPTIAFVLWALYALYRHTFHRMSPTKVIRRVEGKIRKDLLWMAKIARQNAVVIEWKAKDSTVTQHVAAGVMFSRMKPRLQHASQMIEFLFDYHDKLVAAQEHYAAREVLDAVRNILLEYLAARSNSSLRQPVELFGVSESDSQTFLTSTLEDLASRGKQYIASGDDRGATHVIGVFKDAIIASTQVKFYPDGSDENPVFSQLRGYFDQISDASMSESKIEAFYQVVRAYEGIGEAALVSGQSMEFYSIVNKMHLLGNFAARRKSLEIVWAASIHTVTSWMNTLMSDVYIDDTEFSHLFETWIDLTVTGLRNGMRELVLTTTPITYILLVIKNYLDQVFAKWQQEQGDEKRNLEAMLLRIITQFKDKLYELTKALKKSQGQIVNETCSLIVDVSAMLLEIVSHAETEHERKDPKELLHRLINVPPQFIQHAGKSERDGDFEPIVDAVVRIGLMSYQRGNDEQPKQAVEIVARIANAAASEAICSYGNIHGPRIMEKACYFGILALKDGKTELLAFTKAQLKAFESTMALYQEQMLRASNQADATKNAAKDMSHQVMQIRDAKREVHPHFRLIRRGRQAQRMFLPMIEIVDVDRFTKHVWETWATPSPLDKEVEEEQRAKELRKTIVELQLRYKIKGLSGGPGGT